MKTIRVDAEVERALRALGRATQRDTNDVLRELFGLPCEPKPLPQRVPTVSAGERRRSPTAENAAYVGD